jgi:membrane protease YdiL (CAAX protease family)
MLMARPSDGTSSRAAAPQTRGASPDVRRAVALAVPAAVPAGMALLFPALVRLLGPRRGFLAAFAVYWWLSLGLTVALLGPRRAARLLVRRPRASAPPLLAAAVLATPPLGAGAMALALPSDGVVATPLAVSAAIAGMNAVSEELLWRGLPAEFFPDDALRGWLWPALGFTLWHAAPLWVSPHPRWARLFAGAAVMGAGFGYLTWRSGSVRPTVAAHALTDFGLVQAVAYWLGDDLGLRRARPGGRARRNMR